ncbi:MAG: response regulator [Taibaiella sp.]|nr:response regulator [Taibaiella sp.]
MATQQKHIFVVDDDEMMLAMLGDHLRKNPLHKVTTFSTGEDCISNLALGPDVIILDYQLNNVVPDAGDGMQILQQIKKLNKAVKVIMLSSQDEYGKALQTVMKGAAEYVVKNNDAFQRIDTILAD